MWKNRFLVFGFLLYALFTGCSGGNSMQDLIGPSLSNGDRATVTSHTPAQSGNTSLMGLWQVTINKESGTIEAVDLRSGNLIINVLGFLEPPALTGMAIDFGTLNFDVENNIVNVDVILKHPINDPVFMGFDVRGVVFGPKVTNADGLTIIPCPEFFLGIPFGYQDGLLGVPNKHAHYEGLAGYKYFCDNLGPEDDLATFMSDPANLATRGVFRNGAMLKRHYDLSWANTTPPITFLVFNYAIYANYDWPAGAPPIDIPSFNISTANSAEAFCLSVTETANSLCYASGIGSGAISLDVEVWDWQGDISEVTIESVVPGVMPKTHYTYYYGSGSTEKSSIYKFYNVSGAPTTSGDLDILITVVDATTFGEAWFLGLLPGGHPLYNERVYNCWIHTTKVMECPQPYPTSIVPSSHLPDDTQFFATVYGTEFIDGPSLGVILRKSGAPDIVATDVYFVDSTQITCNITIPPSSPMGFWDVIVVNGCNAIGTGVGLFEVLCPTPVVSSIDPPNHYCDGELFPAIITGDFFIQGPTIAVALTRMGEPDIPSYNVQVLNETQLYCEFVIPAYVPPGLWNVRVTNGCGIKIGTGNDLFTVVCPTPVVSSIDPNNHEDDNVEFPVLIEGENFVPGLFLGAVLSKAGETPIPGLWVECLNPNQVICNFIIPKDTATGLWNVEVINGCGTVGKGNNLFTVYSGVKPLTWTPVVALNGTNTKGRAALATPIDDSRSSYATSSTFNVTGTNATGGTGGPYTYRYYVSTSNSSPTGSPAGWVAFTFNNGGSFTVNWAPAYISLAPRRLYLWVSTYDGTTASTPILCATQMQLSRVCYQTQTSYPFSDWSGVINGSGITGASGATYGYYKGIAAAATGNCRAFRLGPVGLGSSGKNTYEFYIDPQWINSTSTTSNYVYIQHGPSTALGTTIGTIYGTNPGAMGLMSYPLDGFTGNRYIGLWAYKNDPASTFTWYYDDMAVYEDPA